MKGLMGELKMFFYYIYITLQKTNIHRQISLNTA